MKDESSETQNGYFRIAHPFWIGTLGFGLYLLTMATFYPDKIPELLGPIGKFGRSIGNNYPNFCYGLFITTFIIHVGESIYTYKLCQERKLNSTATVMWVLQTFVFGFASLIRLKPYKPKSP